MSSTRARWAVLGLAVALCLPTVPAGLALDDYLLLARLTQPDSGWAGSAPFDLFRWLDPEHNTRLMDGAGMPWWTFEGARCAFFRPLSSLTHAVDFALFPRSVAFMHAHSLLWFALFLWLTSKTYFELIDDRWTAGVASAFFAFDSAHGVVVGWISNRNALIAGALGVAALLCHHRARQRRSLGFACAAWLYFALALLSGELSVGLVGYLFAYALWLDRGRWLARIAGLAPYLVLFGVWTALRHAGEYGSYGIGAYVDPIAEPLDFLRTLPTRWFLLMGSQIGRVVSDIYALAPSPVAKLWLAASITTTAAATWYVWPTLVRSATARFFATGAALSALPLAATIPADRLLVLVGFGVMPPLAAAIYAGLRTPRGFRDARWFTFERARRHGAILVAVVHLLVEPVMLPVIALSISWVAQMTDDAESSVPADPHIAEQVVIVASVPDSVLLTFVPTQRLWLGKPSPEKLYWLNASNSQISLERRDASTLRARSAQGLFDSRNEARSQRFALRAGDKVVLGEMTIEVLELNSQGLPSACDFVFARPLESSRYRWQTWDHGRLREFRVPAPGEKAWVKAS
ncbi:MAG: hypothetical protein ABW321_17360 [Polyangiales bacterium]